jgi:hypothetical protein
MTWWIFVDLRALGAYSWGFVVDQLSRRRVLELLGLRHRDSGSGVLERRGGKDDGDCHS